MALWQARASRRAAERSERVAGFLQQMLGVPDATTGGVLTRVGPQATVAQLLDSAVWRVAPAFPDDPRTRARLYTTIGATLVAQDRAREARPVLDSAVALAAASYGPRSTAFAEASLAAGLAALRGNGFAAAEWHLAAACDALPAGAAARDPVLGELRARVVGARATLALDRGQFRASDSLAAEVLAAEQARTRAPTAARAWALRVLGTTRARDNDAYFVRAIAVMDSLGAPFAVERLDALLGRVGVLRGAGAYAAADSLAREGLRLATLGYGARSREAAHFRSYRALTALLRGDTAAAVAEGDSALAIVDALPDVVAPVRIDVAVNAIDASAAAGRWAAVRRAAARLRAFGLAAGAPLAVALGAARAADALLRQADTATAAARLGEAVGALADEPQHAELRRRLRGQLAQLGR